MTRLDCSVTSCMYNQDHLCSKGDITIGGRNASSSGETCCESFHKKGVGSCANFICRPSATVDVDCEAKDCKYNTNCKCSAKQIGISGRSNASESKQTECGSFCCR